MGKTQGGNNNCYCQDNETTWLNWEWNDAQQQMLDFVRGVVALRKTKPVFRRQKFFQGRSIRGASSTSDICWVGTDGKDVSDDVWNAGFTKCIGLRLDGKLIGEVDDHGEPIEGDTVLLLLNAHHEPISFMLPAPIENAAWEPLMDTAQFPGQLSDTKGGTCYELLGRSVALLRMTSPAIKEKMKEGFVAAEVIAEAAMESSTTREIVTQHEANP
jgi:glycogen operon protein